MLLQRVLLCCTLAAASGFAADSANARLDNARVFPWFAAGGGWESSITLLNLFEDDINYRIVFRGINGQPARVTYRNLNNLVVTSDVIEGRLDDDASHTYVILDSGLLQTGWAQLEYDGESRIGGMLTFRQRVQGRPDFESSVTLARNDETRVYLPFDNTQAFATTVAITNPSTSDTATLRIRFWDASGSEIHTGDLQIGAGTTTAFSIPERFPQLAGRAGQMRIEASGNRLSTIALRFNPSGAFSTVPVISR